MTLFAAITTGKPSVDAGDVAWTQHLPHTRILQKFRGVYTPLSIGYSQWTGAQIALDSNDAFAEFLKMAGRYFAGASLEEAGWMSDNEKAWYDPKDMKVTLEQAFINTGLARACRAKGIPFSHFGFPLPAMRHEYDDDQLRAMALISAYLGPYVFADTPCFYLDNPEWLQWSKPAYKAGIAHCRRLSAAGAAGDSSRSVYPIIMRAWNKAGLGLLPEDVARQQVRDIRAADADGLIVWGDVGEPGYEAEIVRHMEIVAEEWKK